MSDSTASGPTVDRFVVVKTLAAGWIGSADTKATAILSAGGTILAVALAASPTPGRPFVHLLLGGFGAVSIISIVLAAKVIFPRTDRNEILRLGGHDKRLVLSPTYFKDLGSLNYADFVKFLSEISEATAKTDDTEQAFVVAKIAAEKMQFARCSIVAFIVAQVFLGLAVIVSAFW